MSGFFSKPKIPAPSRRVDENQEAERRRIAEEKRKKQMALQARLKARRKGGLRMLLSEEREDAGLGLGDSDSLGPS